MKSGPDIAAVAALLGDPARANMLTVLMDGAALTAGELARHAGVTPQTASSHLSKLQHGNLVTVRKQGRHSYFALSDSDVGGVLEALMGLAARTGHGRTRTGPREPALREARVCYDHLAGNYGVAMFDRLLAKGHIVEAADTIALTPGGETFARSLGIDLKALFATKRPVCKACLDWSVRRSHLAGALGAALLEQMFAKKWAARLEGSRAVVFTRRGKARFEAAFGPLIP